MGVHGRTYLERFLDFVVESPDGCWLWTGATERGYGRFTGKDRKGSGLAHRWIYQQLVGDPGPLQLDHTCENRSCVNPAHLEPVTHLEHMRRSRERRTTCRRDHPRIPENTRLENGYSRCRKCDNENRLRYRREAACSSA